MSRRIDPSRDSRVRHGRRSRAAVQIRLLGEEVRTEARCPRIAEIQARVCARFDLRRLDMITARRNREIVRPRQVAMYLARHLTARTLPEIGRMFGGRDHTTVMHACRQIEKLRATDAELDAAVRGLAQDLSR